MVGVPTVRVVGTVAVAVCAAALVVFSGTSSASPKRVGQVCGGLPAYNDGPEVVFGRPNTLAAAQKLQAQVVAQGFTVTWVPGCAARERSLRWLRGDDEGLRRSSAGERIRGRGLRRRLQCPPRARELVPGLVRPALRLCSHMRLRPPSRAM